MKKKIKEESVAEGLHLFAVDLVLSNGTNTLWITAKQKCFRTAVRKAELFLRRNSLSYPNASIHKVDWRGTLDA